MTVNIRRDIGTTDKLHYKNIRARGRSPRYFHRGNCGGIANSGPSRLSSGVKRCEEDAHGGAYPVSDEECRWSGQIRKRGMFKQLQSCRLRKKNAITVKLSSGSDGSSFRQPSVINILHIVFFRRVFCFVIRVKIRCC